jgi:hypothetical protein
MKYRINTESNKDNKFLAFHGKIQGYVFPTLWCLLWFVYDPLIYSQYKLIYYFSTVLMIGALFFSIIQIFARKANLPQFNLIGWILLFSIFIELFNGSFAAKKLLKALLTSRDVYNLFLIFILVFYINSYKKLINFINIFLISILTTVILVGFYQYSVGNTILNLHRFEQFGVFQSIDTRRLNGLINWNTNNTATIILVFLGFILSEIVFRIYRKTNFYLLFFGLIALLLTFTRAAWFSLAIMAFYLILNLKNIKQRFVYITALVSIGILIYIAGSTYYMSGFLEQSDRFAEGNYFLSLRYQRIESLYKNFGIENIFIGNGIFSDPGDNCYQMTGINSTIHNQFLDFVLTFGLIFSTFVFFNIVKQMITLHNIYKCSGYSSHVKMISLGLMLSQIGIIAAEIFNSNRFYYIILLYMLSFIFLKELKSSKHLKIADRRHIYVP